MTVPVDRLMAELPLAPHWSSVEIFAEMVHIAGVGFHTVGLSCRRGSGEIACGSAAAIGEFPYERAYFELLERTSILDAISARDAAFVVLNEAGEAIGNRPASTVFPAAPPGVSWRYALSNGVAAQRCWELACDAARRELAERDHVLRAWFGAIRPNVVSGQEGIVPPSLEVEYEIVVCSLGATSDLSVGGVFAFPRSAHRPFACGFSAGSTLDGALHGAARECMQALSFLWGESLPAAAPPVSADPAYHQEFYLLPAHQSKLRAWLDGAHVDRGHALGNGAGGCEYADLTPAHLRDRMRVAKALPCGELPLTFGLGHPSVVGELPPELAVHPIA